MASGYGLNGGMYHSPILLAALTLHSNPLISSRDYELLQD